MKTLCIILIGACLVIPVAFSQPAPTPPKRISVADLNQISVIGQLGVPLGTVVDIEATIVTSRRKAHTNQFLLSVTKVKGKALDKPEMIVFDDAPGSSADLPSNTSDLFNKPNLFEEKKGDRAEQLTEQEKAQIVKDYVGQNVKLYVYELGQFSGLPVNSLDGIGGGWQGTNFHFSTYLLTLARGK